MSDMQQAEEATEDQVTDGNLYDGPVNDEVETTEEVPAESTEAADDATAEDEPVKFDDRQQGKVNEIVAEKVAKLREEERKAAELQRRLDEIEASKPKETRPQIPQMPDQFDDNFEERVRERDEALTRAAAFDAQQTLLQQQQAYLQNQQALQQQNELNNKANTYLERAKDAGIDEQTANSQGEQVIAALANNKDLVFHIVDDEQGPAIVSYLSKNPLELDNVRTMPPLKAAAYIESVVKNKAKTAPARRTTAAPAPVDSVRGNGSPQGEEGPPGATFE